LVNQIVSSMSITIAPQREASTAAAYVLLSQVIPPVPPACSGAELASQALEAARQLGHGRSPLVDAMCREFASHDLPLGFLADRLAAFWAEHTAWQEPDATASLRWLAGVLRLGVVNDDRERDRSWYFWLLVLSADTPAELLAEWRGGIAGAR